MTPSSLSSTHTFVLLELSPAAFSEIHDKLKEADYGHAFLEEDGQVVIDMHGIGVSEKTDAVSVSRLHAQAIKELSQYVAEWTNEESDEFPDPKYLHRWLVTHGETLLRQLRGSDV